MFRLVDLSVDSVTPDIVLLLILHFNSINTFVNKYIFFKNLDSQPSGADKKGTEHLQRYLPWIDTAGQNHQLFFFLLYLNSSYQTF